MNNPAGDGVFNPQSNITRQSDGSWEISGRQNTGKYHYEVRMDVNTLKGQQEWKNVEITGYAKVIYANPPFDSLDWYARGGNTLYPIPARMKKTRIWLFSIRLVSFSTWLPSNPSF